MEETQYKAPMQHWGTEESPPSTSCVPATVLSISHVQTHLTQPPHEAGSIRVPGLQERRWRYREVKQLL